jgi:hypothetical protein
LIYSSICSDRAIETSNLEMLHYLYYNHCHTRTTFPQQCESAIASQQNTVASPRMPSEGVCVLLQITKDMGSPCILQKMQWELHTISMTTQCYHLERHDKALANRGQQLHCDWTAFKWHSWWHQYDPSEFSCKFLHSQCIPITINTYLKKIDMHFNNGVTAETFRTICLSNIVTIFITLGILSNYDC